LLPAGKTQYIFYAVLAGVVTCLLLNILLVPHWKSVGAAVANVATECVVTAGYIYYMRRFFIPRLQWRYAWHALVGCLIFIPIIYWIRAYHFLPLISLLLSAIFCSIAFFAIQWWIFRHHFLLNFMQPLKDWMLRKKNLLPDEY
jgi:O-antigen/teichoic acid export membrane protein